MPRIRPRLLPFGAVLLAGTLAGCMDVPTAAPEHAPALSAAAAAAAEPEIMFGPQRFTRSTGKPTAESVPVGGNFSAFEAPFVLHVRNGEPDGSSRVSSARVWLDGVLLFGPERFSQQLDSLSVEVSLEAGSVLTVENAGAPGSYLEIRIEGIPVAAGEATLGPDGGRVRQRGLAEFEFPAGFFPTPRLVSVTEDADSAALARFMEFEGLFRVATRSPSVVRLLAGTDVPDEDEFLATLTVPAGMHVPAGHRPELFVQVYEDVGEEVLDNFQLIPSTYDPVQGTLMASVPTWAFTETRRTDGQYEALFMIGTTPGGTNDAAPMSAPVAALGEFGATAASECKAAFIGRPVPANVPVTSPYGVRRHPISGKTKMHWGTDFGAGNGTQVVSAADGKVEAVRNDPKGFGRYMIVRHTDGSATLYAHLQSTSVPAGTEVKRGDPIAKSNDSGGSTGPHLHFEYVPNGEIVRNKNRIDPAPCLQERNVSGSITVRDNGNLADDAFTVYLDGRLIGQTAIGQSNSIALNNLIPGSHTLRVTAIIAPDNVGTYEVILSNGITFAGGGTRASGTIPQGGSATATIIVPSTTAQSFSREPEMLPNEVVEVPVPTGSTPEQ
ncbi:MAG TPA: M23 family metallopeptidase [Longimicrobium sp.]|nr:M23 family metallopeptidase [Longimicrobium sp.]